MAPQTSLFKVFSVGQITSIKCCPHAARRLRRKRKKRVGEAGEGEEQKLNHVEIAEFGRGFLNALSLTHSLSHSVGGGRRPRRPSVRLFLNIIIRGLDNCPRRTDGNVGGARHGRGRTRNVMASASRPPFGATYYNVYLPPSLPHSRTDGRTGMELRPGENKNGVRLSFS